MNIELDVADLQQRIEELEAERRGLQQRVEVAERELQERSLQHNELVQTIGEGVWRLDADARTTFVNAHMANMLGYAVDEMIGRSLFDFMDEESGKVAAVNMARRKTGIREELSARFQHKDGAPVWTRVRTGPLYDTDGQYAGALAAISNVTQRRESEDDAAWFWTVLDRSLNEIYLFDAETLRFEYVNEGALRNLGYPLARVRELTPLDIKPEVTAPDFDDFLAPLRKSERAKVVFETVHQRADGSRYPVAVHLQLVNHGSGRVFLAVVNDISERRQLEAQFMEAQKLESIGRLAGGVAHDFNNLLTAILGYAELLEEAETMRREDVREIRRAGERARDLTQQLLAFARKQVISPRSMDLNSLVRDASRLLSRLLGDHIRVVSDLAPDLSMVRVDGSQIGQVLMNLAVNARDAMPSGGALTISTSNALVDPGAAQAPKDVPAGEYVVLSVSDTGSGIDAAALAHLFEPFFTTKVPEKGTGLGLSTVYGIMKQSGGYIEVQTEVDVGTTFALYFPRCATEVVQPKPRVRAKGSGSERVLVVEDDAVVRGLTVKVLSNAGYQVLAAESPHAALRIWSDPQVHVDLLLTDMLMPGMNGKELAVRMRSTHPAVRVLFMSGHTEEDMEDTTLQGQFAFLPKPFTPSSVLEKVRRVLDSA